MAVSCWISSIVNAIQAKLSLGKFVRRNRLASSRGISLRRVLACALLVPMLASEGYADDLFAPAEFVFGAGSISANDIDGDGNCDLMGHGGLGFSVVLGGGDGTFSAPVVTEFPGGGLP